mgnify:CR=1 FL=1
MRMSIFVFMVLFRMSSAAHELSQAEYKAAEKYIIESSKDWAKSVVTGDMSQRKVYFSDDFIGTSTTGNLYDKTAVTRETGPATYTLSNEVNSVKVRFFGETAIAHGDETWKKKDGSTGRYVWTDIWIFHNGIWQIVAAQDAKVIEDDGNG